MSYDLLVFDPAAAPRARAAFLNWQERLEWTEDAAITTPALRSWLMEMLEEFPEGDPHDVPGGTDYRIGVSAIDARFPWTSMERAFERVSSLAAKHRLGLFDASFGAREVWLPGEAQRLVLLHRTALDPNKVPVSVRHLLPYAERYNIGDDVDRASAIDALNDKDLEELARCFDIDDNALEEFDDWTTGPETANPSNEYLAMVVLMMAADHAKFELERRRGTLRTVDPHSPEQRDGEWKSLLESPPLTSAITRHVSWQWAEAARWQSFEFKCVKCGQVHRGIPTFAAERPLSFYAVPEADREKRCAIGMDDCVIDGAQFYIRGCLEVPVHDLRDPLIWGVWASLSKTDYAAWAGTFAKSTRGHIGPFTGRLDTRLKPYLDTVNLEVTVRLRDFGNRPGVQLQSADHPLAIEQREGITIQRVVEIYSFMVHPSAVVV